MAKKQNSTIPAINYGNIRAPKHSVNVPTITDIGQDIIALNEMLGDGTDKLTPFGHKRNCDGGKIDTALLNGITTLSGLSILVGTSKTSKASKVSEGAKARRVRNHITWMADTASSGGGIVKRLENVYGKDAKKMGKSIAKPLRRLADYISAVYKLQYDAKANAKS